MKLLRVGSCVNLFIVAYSMLCVNRLAAATTWTVYPGGGGDFTTISDAVTSPSVHNGDTIQLEANQIFSGAGNRGIEIKKNLTFDTTDSSSVLPIIDLSSSNYLFLIDSGYTVTINNLFIEHGTGYDGGVIENYGTLNLENCIFSSNTAHVGAAVYNDNSLNVANCTFNNNSSYFGAIANLGTLSINNSTFSGNSAIGNGKGGAIYHGGSFAAIYSSTFSGNSAPDGGYGAVIYAGDLAFGTVNLNIYNCTFSGNTASHASYAGAIYSNGSVGNVILTAYSCTFSGNSGGYAGAIYNTGHSGSALLTVTDCVFSYNSTNANGGAIYNDDTSTANSCMFNNSASAGSGGAIENKGAMDITHCSFNASNATLDGGAIYNGATLTADSCMFNNSASGGSGGAIENKGALNIIHCSFNASNATLDGGAIYNDDTLTADSCTFSGNSAHVGSGGAIENEGALNITNCSFSASSAHLDGGAIYNGATLAADSCIFSSASAGSGGAIYNDGNNQSVTLTVTGCAFINNSASTNGGGAIYNYGSSGNATLTAYSCTFSGNSAVLSIYGGAIFNEGNNGSATLTVTGCTFTYNSAGNGGVGGAIYNVGEFGTVMFSLMGCAFNYNSAGIGGAVVNACDHGTVSLAVSGCNFINNSTTSRGGAIYNQYANSGTGPASINCCRFVGNSSPSGSALYNSSGHIDVTNNWWGSNSDPSTVPNLIFINTGATVTSYPWIVMAIQASQSNLLPGILSNIAADFTQNSSGQPIGSCMPDGSPIAFSTTGGTVTPLVAPTASGLAKTLLSLTSTASVCAHDADMQETPTTEQCTEVTYNPLGLYRLNYGCICSDTIGTQHILVGSYNNAAVNQIEGWVFDEVQATCSQISPLILTPGILYNVAVYNEPDIINIAVLTTTSNTYNLSLATCAYNGSTYVITPTGTPLTLSAPAFKVQWAVVGGNAYTAVDTIDNIRVYPVDLSSYTIGTPIQTPNMGNNQYASDFLYWLYQDNGLFLVQGFNNTNIATYQVDLTGTPTIYPGVLTDGSSTFSFINSCATCFNYFIVGGSAAGQGTLAQYSVNSDGSLNPIRQYTTPAGTTVNYCERCCCQDSQLLVGTDVGLFNYAIGLDNSLTLTSSLSDGNNWLNVCWCCNNSNKYCAAVNNVPSAFVLEQMTQTFTTQCSLE